METVYRVRTVHINQGPERVLAFLRQVPKLPRWSRAVNPAGAHVTIDAGSGPRGRRLVIRTRSGAREEVATVEVRPAAGGTQLRFFLRLPAARPRAQVAHKLAQVVEDLQTLKSLLEPAAAQAA